jgi:DtxR family manganese transport transcriptional regulator
MTSPSNAATPFIATRQHHDAELAEDYVEVILDLIADKGEAKVCDLAAHFGVSHVTVIRTIQRLRKKELLCAEPSAPLRLTQEGMQLAKLCKARHQFLLRYLIALGVPPAIAAIDVEGMEHHISPETIDAMCRHLDLL